MSQPQFEEDRFSMGVSQILINSNYNSQAQNSIRKGRLQFNSNQQKLLQAEAQSNYLLFQAQLIETYNTMGKISKVAVVGCGPVGMLACLLLEHYKMDYIALERAPVPRTHPSAHYLSANSKAIMSQIPRLNTMIAASQEDWKYFRYYRYMDRLFGNQLGLTDHFPLGIEQSLRQSEQAMGHQPNHIPQFKLLEIMHKRLESKDRLLFSQHVNKITQSQGKGPYTLLDKNGKEITIAENVILCSGMKDPMKIELPTSNTFTYGHHQNITKMKVINIHFQSAELARHLKNTDSHAMLHFIYNREILAILVNHSIEEGIFVLQVPNFQPLLDLSTLYSGRELIQMILPNKPEFADILQNANIINIGKWEIDGIMADRMRIGNIFVAGDSAHAYPPAGGFGMNSGFQDIHELIHTLKTVEMNPYCNKELLFSRYSEHRRDVNRRYLEKAVSNYKITQAISSSLGFTPQIMNFFPSNSSLVNTIFPYLPKPKPEHVNQLRLKALKYSFRPTDLRQPALKLIFDQFDTQSQNLSKIRNKLLKNGLNYAHKNNSSNKFYNLYANPSKTDIQQIQKLYGTIDTDNILWDASMKEALVDSAGNLIIQ